ncbi:hypothetical protein BS333_21310 (plasmid) [Vibrio azureus]|uniref:Uncharacterized protein n=1 Tax=Vibrio azureus NBRC 104587 TaxID=1219077 RepID=U3CCW7_9VIBR|nr:hypothetical protein [Vibrio azureus]AUI88921.1 hypothetical protein BS333_21310 [Vibrio azureus]GAD76188.1 hypothetical protein VAZ01S_039_00130 [Vibrio azureus NBRC 104587]
MEKIQPQFSKHIKEKTLEVEALDFVDITNQAKEAGFYFECTGISRLAFNTVVNVPETLQECSQDSLIRQLLKLAWRAARKVPESSQVTFTVCKPPTVDSIYINQPVDLFCSIELSNEKIPMLIITTKEEVLKYIES